MEADNQSGAAPLPAADTPPDADPRPPRRRRRWARWVALAVFLVACALGGLAFGYAAVGGRPLAEVFDPDTWRHLYDLLFSTLLTPSFAGNRLFSPRGDAV